MSNPTARTAHQPTRRRRASKRTLRILAWAAGVASFLSPWAVLSLAPKAGVVAAPSHLAPRVIVRHRIVRRVVWVQSPVTSQPSVRYVYVSGGGGSAASVSTGGSHPPP